MAGIALKGQCDFVSIMVPPEVLLKRKMFEEKNILSQELREMLHFQASASTYQNIEPQQDLPGSYEQRVHWRIFCSEKYFFTSEIDTHPQFSH